MSTTLTGYNMPPGYFLHEGDDDATEGLFWFTHCATRADGGMGDIECGTELEIPEAAQVEAWMAYASVLRESLLALYVASDRDENLPQAQYDAAADRASALLEAS